MTPKWPGPKEKQPPWFLLVETCEEVMVGTGMKAVDFSVSSGFNGKLSFGNLQYQEKESNCVEI